jgi:hypothetical protein
LAKHLHSLNSNSIELLDQKGKDSEWYVRLSLITNLKLEDDSSKLNRCVAIVTQRFSPEKMKLLAEAIHTTNNAGDLLGLEELQKIIMKVLSLPKLESSFMVNIKGITMKKWLELIKTRNEKNIIFDADSLATASQTIIDRH